jgi:tripartite-type tricarboxylate transporter receptor subunit TctC
LFRRLPDCFVAAKANMQWIKCDPLMLSKSDAARAKPGDLTLASVRPASLPRIAFQQLKRAANVDITFVPYPGAAAAANALLGEHVTSVLISYAAVGEQMKAGKLRALAIATPVRIEALPDVPTVAECGYAGYEAAPLGVIRPFNCGLLSSFLSYMLAFQLGTTVALAPSELVGVAETGRARVAT